MSMPQLDEQLHILYSFLDEGSDCKSILLKTKEPPHQCKTIRKIMMSQVRVTMQAKMEDGKTLYHRSSTKAEREQKEIYRALGISPQILKAHKNNSVNFNL